jgi:hypothetical protein
MKPSKVLSPLALSGVALLALICGPEIASAADKSPGNSSPGARRAFSDPFIENLVGDWRIRRKIRGKEVENTATAKWVLNHQFLELHMKDVADPPTYEAMVMIGYDHATGRYVAHWCDTYGGGFSAMGRGKRSGDSIEFEFQYPDGPFYNTFTWNAPAKSWICRMESQRKDGKRALFAVDTLRRP